MKRKVILMFLSAVMLMCIIPFSIAASDEAEETESVFPTEDVIEISTAEDFKKLANGGNFRLSADIKGAKTVVIDAKTVNLDLNGHTLEADGSGLSDNRFIRLQCKQAGGTLMFNLYDTKGGGKITHSGDSVDAPCVIGNVDANIGIFNMYGGEISGWNTPNRQILHFVNVGFSVNLYSGKITGCTAGKALVTSKDLTVHDGFIIENNTFVNNAPMFAEVNAGVGKYNIKGGIFNNNGGVKISLAERGSEFVVSGGTFNDEVTANVKPDNYTIAITGGLFKVQPSVELYDVEAYELIEENGMYKMRERIIIAKDNGNGTHIVLDPSNPDVGKNMPHSGGTATCIAKARCELCVVEYGELAPHNQDIVEEGREATCSKFGSTAEKKCSVCGTVVVSREVIPQLEHTPGDWETVKEAAVGVEGLKVQKCTDCGKELNTEKIAALTEGGTPGTDPGTTDPGTTEPDDGFPIVIVIVAAVAVVAVALVAIIVIKIRNNKQN